MPTECTNYYSLERLLLYHNIIKSIPDLEFDGHWDDWSSTLRGTALVVILMRAGLGLDPVALRRLSGKFQRTFLPHSPIIVISPSPLQEWWSASPSAPAWQKR